MDDAMIKSTQYLGLSLLLWGYSSIALAEDSLVDERVKGELATSEKPFVITPHKANYLLPVTYQTRTNSLPFEIKYPDEDFSIDNLEAKFQISFKFPIMYNVFGDNGHLFFAYTNQSYWQSYNEEASSPFS